MENVEYILSFIAITVVIGMALIVYQLGRKDGKLWEINAQMYIEFKEQRKESNAKFEKQQAESNAKFDKHLTEIQKITNEFSTVKAQHELLKSCFKPSLKEKEKK